MMATETILFLECNRCSLVFKLLEFFPSEAKERSRYQLHENDVNDADYQHFVAPIVEAIIQEHSPKATDTNLNS